jgi:hypothetical protein
VDTRHCKSCGRDFVPCPRVKNQQYCSDRACQRARKRRWQKEKLAQEEAYRLNQKAARKAWRDKNPGYWKKWREDHLRYVEKNRDEQNKRRARKKAQRVPVAKMDASRSRNSVISGRYQLVPLSDHCVAKMDAINVEIRVLSSA